MEIRFDPPSEKQKAFLTATSKYVAFGGARGGGKSWAVRTKASLLALRRPGIRVLIVRRTYPELTHNHIELLRKQLVGAAVYNDRDKALRFTNGSEIDFTYCARDADLDRMQGVEYDVMFLDEATQLSEYQIRTLAASIRGANGHPKRMYLTCNPGGQGHGYIKRLFVDRDFRADENPADHTFIRSLVTDNAALMRKDPDYLERLRALPPKLRAAWLEGRWDVYEGQFFEEFRDDPAHYADRVFTHVIDPFDIPESWRLYRSFDWGYAKPYSCGWWAVDPDGAAYRILELYGCGETPNEGLKHTPDRVFAEIRRIENEHPWLRGRRIRGVADPAIWDAQTGESIAESAAKQGVFFEKGDNRRLPGWMQLHYRLRFDPNGFPMLYVFRHCRAFIRTLPLLTYDPHRPEDLDTAGEDHAADEARYFCMCRPISAPRAGEAEPKPGVPWLGIAPGELEKAGARKRMEILS